MSSRPTITDVARAAGVAVGTASDALNQKGRVSDATRARVLAAATALGFRPHRAARGLSSGRTFSVGLRFSHDTAVPAGGFFIDLLQGAAEAANEAGFGLQITAGSFDESRLVDGLVVVDPSSPAVARARGDRTIPVVTVGRVGGGRTRIPWVDVDHRAAMTVLLGCLAQRATGGPAWLLSLPRRLPFVRDLEDAFASWCAEHDRPAQVLRAPDHPLAAADALRAELARTSPPALVVTVLDRQAVGVHHALREVPAAVPLGCASDDDGLAVLDPPVPGMALGGREHGRAAVAMTLDWIHTGTRPQPRLLPADLVVRDAGAREPARVRAS